MMKKWFVGMMASLLCMTVLILPCAAAGERGKTVVDKANLLTESEEAELTASLDALSAEYGCDLVILTVDSLGTKSPRDYADDYYDQNGYGIGPQKSGALFLISMEDRDWWMLTRGGGITAFTDWGIDYIFSKMKDDLADNDFYGAFQTYARTCELFLKQDRAGEPFDRDNQVKEIDFLFVFGVGAIVGLVVAGIVIGVMASGMKSVKRQPHARNYVVPGSLNLTRSSDLFLYSTVTRVKKQSSSSSGRGGSSTHTSSSGATHGGGGGKF